MDSAQSKNETSKALAVVMAALLGTGGAITAGTAEASYCTISGCVVTPPPGWSPPGGGGGGGGGWGGGNSTFNPCDENPHICETVDPVQKCEQLALTKPANCPNPIPYPAGFNYGSGDFASGSGMARAIYFVDHQVGVGPEARATMKKALEDQTRDFSYLSIPFNESMSRFVETLTEACDLQRDWSGRTAFLRPESVLTVADERCLQIVDRMNAEADNRQGFINWFLGWVDRDGIVLSDLAIPQTIINLISPQNSSARKYDRVVGDAMCSHWWTQVQHFQCPI